MSLYAIGDLHLSLSEEVSKPMDMFGPLWFDYVKRLRENWEKTIGDEDTVVIPGDISWGLKFSEAEPDLEWIDALAGRKVIFKGNHDLWWTGINRLNSLYDSITFVQNTAYYCEREGVYLCGSRGWITPDNEDFKEADRKIYNRECLRLKSSLDDAKRKQKDVAGEIIGVLHYPPVSKQSVFSKFQQIFMDYEVKTVIYGHVHGEEGFRNAIKGDYYGTFYYLTSLDYLKCMPMKLR